MVNKNFPEENFQWIIYHLEAMNYARDKFEKKMAEFPSGTKLTKLRKDELRHLISKIKELTNWYKSQVEYHQQKAISHIPTTTKTKKRQNERIIENKSLERVFVKGNNTDTVNTEKAGFRTGDKLLK
ncbi:MAG: hypothetical protein ACTSRS_23155 [Candidatus Helarchaeota archaeon]